MRSEFVSSVTGVAAVFLATPLKTLADAVREHLPRRPELPPDTKFWVCDFVIRQLKPHVKEDVKV